MTHAARELKSPYYVIPSERLQELLERASEGEEVEALMVEQYEIGDKERPNEKRR